MNVQTVATKKMIKERSDSQKLAWTLCIIFIVFLACWTPHIVLSVSVILVRFPFEFFYRQLPILAPRASNVIMKIFHLVCWQINRKLIPKSNTGQITKVLYQKAKFCLNVCMTVCLSVKTIYTIFIYSSLRNVTLYYTINWKWKCNAMLSNATTNVVQTLLFVYLFDVV